jgi:L-ribulose-5-phosphate 3-epimerase
MNRRDFLISAGAGAAGAVVLGAPAPLRAAPGGAPRAARPRIRKAVGLGMVQGDQPLLEKFRMLREIGYEGVEINSPNQLNRDEVLRARDATGLEIHGVVNSVHWNKPLSDPDPAVRLEGQQGLRAAIEDAKAYGATTVLLVPAVVNENVSYAEAYERSQAEIRQAIPFAAERGIIIAIENVWNQFLLSPLEFARYVDEFQSPWVQAYFDIGNVVTFGWPEHWIGTLGSRIRKLHVKEFSREKRDAEGLWAGFRVEIGEGSIDWPVVREAIDAIGYTGWATAEVGGGGRARLAEVAARMDRVLQQDA